MTNFPTILVLRRARTLGEDWHAARSWLGGLPRIGAQPWPRGFDDRPLVFMAQIDLAELALASGPTDLPSTGALAFFMGLGGAVLYMAPGETGEPADLPRDGVDLLDAGGDYSTDLSGRGVFPHWPIEFHRLPVENPPRDWEREPSSKVQYFADLKAAADAFVEGRPKGDRPSNMFDRQDLEKWWRDLPRAFPDNMMRGVHPGAGAIVRDLESRAVFEAAAGPEHAYALLPRRVRDEINASMRMPFSDLHQIFGLGQTCNGSADEEYDTGNHMLLQLHHDDCMLWSIGGGYQQAFISPEDLAKRNWSAANVMGDC